MLDPIQYEQLGKESEWDINFGYLVAGPVLPYTATRRGMLTPMKYRGETTYPSVGIPRMTVHTEEFEHSHK
jgi:hypothetical protein